MEITVNPLHTVPTTKLDELLYLKPLPISMKNIFRILLQKTATKVNYLKRKKQCTVN